MAKRKERDWSLADLRFGKEVGEVPRDVLRQLANDFHKRWCGFAADPLAVVPSLCTTLGLTADGLNWDDIEVSLEEDTYVGMRLTEMLGAGEAEAVQQCRDASKALYQSREVFKVILSFMYLSTGRPTVHLLAPEDRSALAQGKPVWQEHIDYHDDTTDDAFTNVFVHLQHILRGCHYYRFQSSFCVCVTLADGTPTSAFRTACTVQEFVKRHTNHNTNFKVWRWATRAHAEARIIAYLCNNPLPEAPDLVECRHLRSYGGDEHGRGAGVYDAAADMFFGYHCRSEWEAMALKVQAVRRQDDPSYTCTAPRPRDACVVHLAASGFPYDVFAEVMSVVAVPRHLQWRNAHAFECTDAADELPGEAGGGLLAERLAQQPCDTVLEGRILLTEAEWSATLARAADVTRRSFCVRRDAGGQVQGYYRVFTGRCWEDEAAAAASPATWDVALVARGLRDVRDRFLFYAHLGRLFFHVGERDTRELSFFLSDADGAAAACVRKTLAAFWPEHRRVAGFAHWDKGRGAAAADDDVATRDVAFFDWHPDKRPPSGPHAAEWKAALRGGDVDAPWRPQALWTGVLPPCVESLATTTHMAVARLHGTGWLAGDVCLGTLQRRCLLAYAALRRMASWDFSASAQLPSPPPFALDANEVVPLAELVGERCTSDRELRLIRLRPGHTFRGRVMASSMDVVVGLRKR